MRLLGSFHRIRIKILSSITNLQNREGFRKAVDDLFAAFCMFYTPDHRLCYCIPNKNMLNFQNLRYNLFKSVLRNKQDHIIIQSKCITINFLVKECGNIPSFSQKGRYLKIFLHNLLQNVQQIDKENWIEMKTGFQKSKSFKGTAQF